MGLLSQPHGAVVSHPLHNREFLGSIPRAQFLFYFFTWDSHCHHMAQWYHISSITLRYWVQSPGPSFCLFLFLSWDSQCHNMAQWYHIRSITGRSWVQSPGPSFFCGTLIATTWRSGITSAP